MNPDPTEDEITAVIVKLGEGRWIDFTERETEVAKWIVGWDDDPDIMDVREGNS